MPASSTLVSLDQAKDWAKRLFKHGPYAQLAQAQEAVATMLGHASWHALMAAYRAPASEPPAPPTGSFWDRVFAVVNARHPELKATRLVTLARELDVFEDMPHAISTAVEDQEADQYGWDDLKRTIDEAVSSRLATVIPPPDHIFVRLQTPHGLVLLTLPQDAVPSD